MENIVVVGSLNMDLVVRVAHMPLAGETIFGHDFATIPGGKGANQAIAAARLGGKVTMIGRIGSDTFGETLIKNLKKEGVDTSFMQVDKDASSGIALITVDKSGQNSIVVVSGANMRLLPDVMEYTLDKIDQFSLLLLQLESPLECVERAARIARNRGAKVILNPSPVGRLPEEFLKLIDILVPNDIEASQITNLPISNLEEAEVAARHLIRMGVGAVVLTLGKQGVLVVRKDIEPFHLRGHPVEVVDTTAAGDAFIGGLGVGLSEGLTLFDASRLGNAAAALTVTRMGAQPSLPYRKDVNTILGMER
jgi:ribokinase